ncbi:MAG: hypothetical protein ACI8UZ_002809 [Akkermansiaceae bacterium]|jgi:hypothetical protein
MREDGWGLSRLEVGLFGLVRRVRQVRHHGADFDDDSVDEGFPFGFGLGSSLFAAELGNPLDFLMSDFSLVFIRSL